MLISKKRFKLNTLSIIIAIAAVLVLSMYIKYNYVDSFNRNSQASIGLNSLSEPTSVNGLNLNYEELLKGDDGKIYEDNKLKLFTVNKSGIAQIIYVYKNKPEGREITDNFFVHIYVKDSINLMGNATYANVDFFQKPEPITFENKTYYIFHKALVSNNYKEEAIPLHNINYIRTGRFKPKMGRSLDTGKLFLSEGASVQLMSDLDQVHITLKSKDFAKILDKRQQAIDIGVLSSEDGDLVEGKISLNSTDAKDMELRLKGDWPDHLLDKKKWSYRIVMKGGKTFKGMRKFSIQHPKVRNYLWEWLFNKVIKDEEIIGLRYDFADIVLTITDKKKDKTIDIGLMAVEESFDKILIENNKKREGVIIAFDESLYWSDVKKERKLKLDKSAVSSSLRTIKNAPIRVFNEGKVLSDPVLAKQFEVARDLLDGLRQSKYKVSEVFDLDKLTTFVAINNLFNGYHGLVWHNLRIYYNPITGKLEPISFDSNNGQKLTKITHYPFAESDMIYQEELRKKLTVISSENYINTFLSRHRKELRALNTSLLTEYDGLFNDEILQYNSNFIKKVIDPSLIITSDLVSYDRQTMDIRVSNLTKYPVIINKLAHEDKRSLSTSQSSSIVSADSSIIIKFKLNDYFINAFVSKKNKKGEFQFPKDISKLRLEHYVSGVNVIRFSEINPYSVNLNLDESISLYKKSNKSNIDQFPFIEVKTDATLIFKTGEYALNKDLVIPPDYTVEVKPGFSLNLKNNSAIRSQSALMCRGTIEKPIKFYSSDSTGQGIFITSASYKSEVVHTYFDNLSNPQSDTWSVSGAVNFHESDVTISHSSFTNNRCEDALNIIRSEFTMTDTVFENTQSDAFDGDFVNGTLQRCTFIHSGNDGIDVSGSTLILEDIAVNNPSDKGISAGENSTISGDNITITGGEIGIVSKDLSTVQLHNVRITDTRLGFSAFQKKSEYGVAYMDINKLILQNVEVDYLIEVNSRLTIDNVAVETVSNNVIEQMYGKEYGKSSR